MIKSVNRIILRNELVCDRDSLYLFGDNIVRVGYGGQAKEMRGEVNAVGIRTKLFPTNKPGSFMSDDFYQFNTQLIDQDIANARVRFLTRMSKHLVVPVLGVGMAQLPTRAPRTYQYLQKALMELCENVSKLPSFIHESKSL